MKTKIFSLFLISIFAFGAAFADGNEKTATSQSKAVGTYIMKHIDYPGFAIENDIEAEVRVSFTVNKDGSVNVIQANCVNKELLKYFLDKMENIKFSPDLAENGKVYNFKYKFELL